VAICQGQNEVRFYNITKTRFSFAPLARRFGRIWVSSGPNGSARDISQTADSDHIEARWTLLPAEDTSKGLQCVAVLGSLASDGKFNYAVDCERGFALERWPSSKEFPQALDQCKENAIEVFWKSSAREG
jgi:hypothetical protein